MSSSHPGLGAQPPWASIPCSQLVTSQQVIQLDSQASVQKACDLLIHHSLQSLPLHDSRTNSYVGMFDLHDLATYILQKHHHHQGNPPVSQLSDLSRLNPFYSVVPETTVAQAMEVFAQGTHRVAVMDASGAIQGILSQTNLINHFFDQQPAESQPLLDQTLQDLHLVSHDDVISARTDTPLLQAISLLEHHQISSLAITDADTRLVGNLSVADLKYLAQDPTLILQRTCREFVQAIRLLQGARQGQDRAAVFSVRPQATLRYALTKLIATKTHRVWITESAKRPPDSTPIGDSRSRRASVTARGTEVPIAPPHYAGSFTDTLCGVVSLTDILKLLLHYTT